MGQTRSLGRFGCLPGPARRELLPGPGPEEARREVANAKAVCAACPVRQACAEAGLYERFGVWGGLDEDECRALRRAEHKEPALNLCCDHAGPLSDDQHADALVMADIAAQVVLVLQADAPPEELAAALRAGADFHYVVHQAAGMVAAQLEVSVARSSGPVAGVRLRPRPFSHRRSQGRS